MNHIRRVGVALIAAFTLTLIGGAVAGATTTATSTATSTSTAPAFTPYDVTCLWLLGPGATAAHPFDDGHGHAVPQALIGCKDPVLVAPCGKTVTGQLDPYHILTAKADTDFKALKAKGVLSSPADDAEFNPHDWSFPTKTGAACETSTPPSSTPPVTTPPITTPPVSTPPVTTPPVTTPPVTCGGIVATGGICLGTPTSVVATPSKSTTAVVAVAANTPLANTGAGNGALRALVIVAVFGLASGIVLMGLGRRRTTPQAKHVD